MFEKKEKSDEPIVMGNVFRRLNFFLTVSWESKYGCLYIFCVIHPEKATWKLISLQKKFSIFPSSVGQLSVLQIRFFLLVFFSFNNFYNNTKKHIKATIRITIA